MEILLHIIPICVIFPICFNLIKLFRRVSDLLCSLSFPNTLHRLTSFSTSKICVFFVSNFLINQYVIAHIIGNNGKLRWYKKKVLHKNRIPINLKKYLFAQNWSYKYIYSDIDGIYICQKLLSMIYS